jgi:uncharacterized membrane protein
VAPVPALWLAFLQLGVGLLLLLFGTRWLRKAVLRRAGLIALHDEAAAFAAESAALRRSVDRAVAWVSAFKAVVLEGLEVIFIVIAVGAVGDLLVPAATGAALAFVAVLAVAAIVHRPLARVPENALKFTVGAMISSFGLYWIGEGLGFGWPGGDFAILGLIAGWVGVALALGCVLKAGGAAPA